MTPIHFVLKVAQSWPSCSINCQLWTTVVPVVLTLYAKLTAWPVRRYGNFQWHLFQLCSLQKLELSRSTLTARCDCRCGNLPFWRWSALFFDCAAGLSSASAQGPAAAPAATSLTSANQLTCLQGRQPPLSAPLCGLRG